MFCDILSTLFPGEKNESCIIRNEMHIFHWHDFVGQRKTPNRAIMKAGIIIWSLGTLLATGAAYSYDISMRLPEISGVADEPEKYCARLRDGKMVVLYAGKEINNDIFLKNGSTIKPDGTVITKDGVRFNLKEGQCIDQNGSIVGEATNEVH